jgi:hypothetical protein
MRTLLLALLLFASTAGGADPTTHADEELVTMSRGDLKSLLDAYITEKDKNERLEHFLKSWEGSTNCARNAHG